MWLTERTLDSWAAAHILRLAPTAYVWCPTSNEQAFQPGLPLINQILGNSSFPYDLISGGGALKLFVIEDKGLGHYDDTSGRITIDIEQFVALRLLNRVGGANDWVFYGVPAPDLAGHVHGGFLPSAAKLEASFGSWQLALTPDELSTLCGRGPLEKLSQAGISVDPTRQAKQGGPYRSFGQLLAQVKGCTAGLPITRDTEPNLPTLQLEHKAVLSATWVVVPVP